MKVLAWNRNSPWAFLQLMRPANTVTAGADVLAGMLITTGSLSLGADPLAPLWLLLATSGLYSGSVVLNDALDADLDAIERPERPIPSGRVSWLSATILGAVLVSGGIGAATQVSAVSGAIALLIAFLAFLYNAWAKHHPIFGPLFMGSCRGCNLLLGCSLMPALLPQYGFLGLLTGFYIAAITLISQGEVHGSQRRPIAIALAIMTGVLLTLLLLPLQTNYQLGFALPFLGVWAGSVFMSAIRAWQDPQAMTIRQAVKTGVLALIVLDAALATGFAGPIAGLLILSLLPLSLGLSRLFAVT